MTMTEDEKLLLSRLQTLRVLNYPRYANLLYAFGLFIQGEIDKLEIDEPGKIIDFQTIANDTPSQGDAQATAAGPVRVEDPDEIPAPDKPIEEWTEEEHEEYDLACWERAEPSTLEYAVKTFGAPADAIAAARDVLEQISATMAADSEREGLRNEFYHESLPRLLECLRQRVREDSAGLAMVK